MIFGVESDPLDGPARKVVGGVSSTRTSLPTISAAGLASPRSQWEI